MTSALTLLPRGHWSGSAPERGIVLLAARRSRPEHLSQTAAAALLGITPREYTFLESGRLTLSADDWARTMEVIRG